MAHSVSNSKNQKQTDDVTRWDGVTKDVQEKYLDMTGKPVLAQNELGIFYGILEKADTRNGTALIRNGFLISPDHHITFYKYLDYLSSEIENMLDEFWHDWLEENEDGELVEKDGYYEAMQSLELPNEMHITMDELEQISHRATITEYASEGIFKVQFRTSDDRETDNRQAITGLISLTNVLAIVPVNSGMFYIDHLKFEEARYGDLEQSTSGMSAYPLENLFDKKANEIEITPQDTFRYLLLSTYSGSAGDVIDEILIGSDAKAASRLTDNPLGLTEGKDLPKLIVNTRQRAELYKKLKQAQDHEQAN